MRDLGLGEHAVQSNSSHGKQEGATLMITRASSIYGTHRKYLILTSVEYFICEERNNFPKFYSIHKNIYKMCHMLIICLEVILDIFNWRQKAIYTNKRQTGQTSG